MGPADTLLRAMLPSLPDLDNVYTTISIVVFQFLLKQVLERALPTTGDVDIVPDVHTSIVVSGLTIALFLAGVPFHKLLNRKLDNRAHIGILCVGGVTLQCLLTHLQISMTGRVSVYQFGADPKQVFYTTYYAEWASATPMMSLATYHFSTPSTEERKVLAFKLQILNYAMFTSGLVTWLCMNENPLAWIICLGLFAGYIAGQDEMFRTIKSPSKDQRVTVTYLRVFYAMSWCLFPIVYFLGRTGLVSLATEIKLYGHCDMIAKCGLVTAAFHINTTFKEELTWLKKVLEHERMKRHVVRYIFHEARVPLNTITLGVSTMDPEDRKGFTKIRKSISESCSSMRHILDDYLVWEKMRSNRFEFENEDFLLGYVTECLHTRFATAASENHVTFKVINEVPRPNAVVGDKHRIIQVGSNFISNALKFVKPQGAVTFKISHIPVPERRPKMEEEETDDALLDVLESPGKQNATTAKRSGSLKLPKRPVRWYRFSCVDDGIGISVADQKELFKPFVQIKPGKSQSGKGTGLGLSICREMAKRMGGHVGIQSELGRGSEFYMEIPLPGGELSTEGAPLGEKLLEYAEVGPFSVLITDDIKTNRVFLARLLGKRKDKQGCKCFDISLAESGEQCLQMSAGKGAFPYDIYLMDNQMPGMVGRDVIARLRKDGVKSLIIGVTGDVISEDKQLMLESGADYVHAKPVKIAELVKTIEVWMVEHLDARHREPDRPVNQRVGDYFIRRRKARQQQRVATQ